MKPYRKSCECPYQAPSSLSSSAVPCRAHPAPDANCAPAGIRTRNQESRFHRWRSVPRPSHAGQSCLPAPWLPAAFAGPKVLRPPALACCRGTLAIRACRHEPFNVDCGLPTDDRTESHRNQQINGGIGSPGEGSSLTPICERNTSFSTSLPDGRAKGPSQERFPVVTKLTTKCDVCYGLSPARVM